MLCLWTEYCAMVKSGSLYKKKNIEELEVMDRSLLRYITGAYVKTQNWFFYLETGVLNIYLKKKKIADWWTSKQYWKRMRMKLQ